MTTWFATTSLVGTVWQEMSETSPGTDATSAVGWTVGTQGGPIRASLDSGTKRASNTFSGTTQPDGTLDNSLGDALRSTNPYTGTFATGTWTFNFTVIGVTNSGAQDGIAYYRILKGSASDGSNATEVTSGSVTGSTVTNLTTTAQTSSATTSSISSFTADNEYIFCQVAWEITGAGGMTTTDVVMRVGTNSTRLVSPTFTAASTVNTDLRVTFPTPLSPPDTGAGVQEFRALVRKVGAFSGTPTAAIELWENGSFKSTRLAATNVSSTAGVVLSGVWDAADLTSADGSNVECKVVGAGAPGVSLEVGALDWVKIPEDVLAEPLVVTTPQQFIYY